MDINTNKRKSILWILIKLKIREALFGNAGKKTKRSASEKAGRAIGGIALIILYVVVYAFMMVSIGFLFFLIGTTMAAGSYRWMYFAYMAIMMFLLCFIGSVFLTETQMFEAKDNERLISMPITPMQILISRMVSLIIYNFFFGTIVSVPAGIISIYLHGFNILWLVFFIVSMIVIPLFALACSMVAGWIISILSKKLKSTKVIKLGIAILGSLLYFYFVLGDGGWVNSLIENGRRFAEPIRKNIPPAYSVGKALGENDPVHFILMLAWCILPFVLASFIVSRNFLSMISSGGSQSTIKYKSTGVHVRSPFNSLVKIEMNRFFSSITYIMNGGMGLLLMVILAFFGMTNKNSLNSLMMAEGYIGSESGTLIGALLCLAILGVMGMVCISSATISLEANTLWILKSIPAKASDVIFSKAMPHILVSIPFIIVTGILLQFNISMPLINRILLLLIPLTANVFNAIMGVRINARFPKFNWTNEAQAIKQGLSSMLVMIMGVLPVIVFLLGFIFLVFQSRITVTTLMILMEVVYLLLTAWMIIWGIKKSDKVLSDLQNN